MDKCTRELLDLQEEWFDFPEENWLSLQKDRWGLTYYHIESTFKDIPMACESCGAFWGSSDDVYAHGYTPKPRSIQLPDFNGMKTLLKVRIPRFKCRHCGKTSSAQLPEKFVMKGSSMSRKLFLQIAFDLKLKVSMKDIHRMRHVPYHMVYRTFKGLVKRMKLNTRLPLPRVLCVDEFKATKDCEGDMAFIAMDGETHEILTVLDDRRIEALKKHLMDYSYEERCQVAYLVMDMNASYQELVKHVFPKAQIVTDRFHVVQHMTTAFNQVRIAEMKPLKGKKGEPGKQYRRLKKYWRHLLKPYENLSTKVYYNRLFKQDVSTQSLTNKLLSYNETIHETWEVTQLLMTAMSKGDDDLFFEVIRDLKISATLPEPFVKKLKFLLKKEDSIRLAMKVSYSNGCLEGTNNKIKSLKRAAFGYTRFEHFKAKIYLAQNMPVFYG